MHSDLKSENVLVKVDYRRKSITQVKIIDFGSSFDFSKIALTCLNLPSLYLFLISIADSVRIMPVFLLSILSLFRLKLHIKA